MLPLFLLWPHFDGRKTYVLSQGTGWIPQHIIAEDESKNILGVVPLYLKRFRICQFYMWTLFLLLVKFSTPCNQHALANSFLSKFAAIPMVNMYSIILGQMPITIMVWAIIQSCNARCLSLQLLAQGSWSVTLHIEIKSLTSWSLQWRIWQSRYAFLYVQTHLVILWIS